MIDFPTQRYALIALASAALFGLSTPLAKLLLDQVSPAVLAGLLYLGSGLGLGVAWMFRAILSGRRGWPAKAVSLARRDLPWLAGSVASGGIFAPLLLLWGVSGMPAADASLLLNTEAVLTALVAAMFFGEAVGTRVWIASALLLAAGALLSYQPGAGAPVSLHAIAVVAACLCWALDNSFTRNIAAGDALTIAMAKGLVAGAVNLVLGLAAGGSLPGPTPLAAALALGAASYGASLVLYIIALRHLGSARTGAHFATAPFIGAAVAIALGEPLTGLFLAALAMMVAATWLVLTEHHAHLHVHARLAHAHRHRHDAHHRHGHEGRGMAEDQDHSHWHVHEPLSHSHPHLPDLHHRHRH